MASTAFSRFNSLSLLGLGVVLVVTAALFLRWLRVDAIGLAIVALIAWWLLSGALAGSLPDRRNVALFLSSEGRTLFAYLPLLVFVVVRTDRVEAGVAVALARLAAALGVLLTAVWAVARPALLSPKGGGRLFFGLTSSHHVAGFLGGMSAIVLLCAWLERRRPVDLALAAGALAIVVASGSRTTMLGLVVVLAWSAWDSGRADTRIKLLGVLVGGGVLVYALVPRVSGTLDRVTDPKFVTEISSSANATSASATATASPTREDAATANVLKRFGVWSVAFGDFAASPFIGVGTWRLNDLNTHRSGISGLVVLERGGQRVHSDFQAHNVILQLLSENGLLGLGLFLFLWRRIWRRLRNVPIPPGRGDVSALARAGPALVVFAVGASLTSNAIMVPGFAASLAVFIGPLIAYLPGDPEAVADAQLPPAGSHRSARSAPADTDEGAASARRPRRARR
ncbi:MAG: O-antigen ligase family protein [Actinobacteria bacterium]|nr:O-antigen ligase family protein [Actinomycetota bacterium]